MIFCFRFREERHYGEHDSDHQPKGYGPKRDPLASRSGLAAGNDVFRLQRRRLAVFLGASFRQPSLSRPQIITAQNKAVVLTVCVPLNCTGKQTRVRVHPIEIARPELRRIGLEREGPPAQDAKVGGQSHHDLVLDNGADVEESARRALCAFLISAGP